MLDQKPLERLLCLCTKSESAGGPFFVPRIECRRRAKLTSQRSKPKMRGAEIDLSPFFLSCAHMKPTCQFLFAILHLHSKCTCLTSSPDLSCEGKRENWAATLKERKPRAAIFIRTVLFAAAISCRRCRTKVHLLSALLAVTQQFNFGHYLFYFHKDIDEKEKEEGKS